MTSPRTKQVPLHRTTPLTKCLSQAIEAQKSLGKTQGHIAREIGYERANMLSMLKRGSTKVPLEKIPALGRALNIDPAFLYRLALEQYWPNEYRTIVEIFGTVCSRNERDILASIRDATSHADPALTPELRKKLETMFGTV